MLAALLFMAQALGADGPDLTVIDAAVDACDSQVMTATFAAEPQRRRRFVIAAFNAQEAIVTAREALAQRRIVTADRVARQQAAASGAPALPPLLLFPGVAGGVDPAAPPVSSLDLAALDREAQILAERQHELDDARMLNVLREEALDLMRRHYVSRCSAGGVVGRP